MRILILGASGFIGSYLTRLAVEDDHEVIALCRSGVVRDFSGDTYKWSLGQPLPLSTLGRIDCAIHLVHDFDGKTGASLTCKSTLANIKNLRTFGVDRQLFFSSYSAGAQAESLYGLTKQKIEKGVSDYPDVIIVRPGLVIGDGGLYSRIRKWARRLPIIPLPDGGQGKVPIITIERLCRETLKLVSENRSIREANLFEPELYTIRQLIRDIASEDNRQPWLVSIPSWLIILVLRSAALIRLPLPVNADNLIGFLANQQANHRSFFQDLK